MRRHEAREDEHRLYLPLGLLPDGKLGWWAGTVSEHVLRQVLPGLHRLGVLTLDDLVTLPFGDALQSCTGRRGPGTAAPSSAARRGAPPA